MLKVFFFLTCFLFHPVHVSMTSIDYVPEISSFKVFVRMSFEDFLRSCKMEPGEFQNKEFRENNTRAMAVMQKYLDEKIVIEINEELLSGKLKKLVLADNEISMNLEYWSGKKPVIIKVKNIILTDLYSDQINMLIVKVNGFEEGFKMSADVTEHTFKIK